MFSSPANLGAAISRVFRRRPRRGALRARGSKADAADGNSNKKYKKAFFYAAAAVCSIILMVTGYWVQRLSETPEEVQDREFLGLLSHVSNEAGIAFLIAIVLAFTIERLTFEEFREMLEAQANAIKENVYTYLTEHSVPIEISNEIKTQILKEVFVRRGLTISYTIEPLDDKGTYPDYVRVSLTLTYQIENLTSADKQFEIKHTVELAPEPALDGEVKFIKIDVSGGPRHISREGKEMVKIQELIGRDRVLSLKNVTIHPGKHGMTTVKVWSETIKHLKGGVDYHIVRHHTCEVDVKVHAHNLDVWAGSVSHIEMQEQADAAPEDGTFHWKAEHPLLAGQNIYVTWMPRDAGETGPQKHASKHEVAAGRHHEREAAVRHREGGADGRRHEGDAAGRQHKS
jgi:hypothetical protein